MPDHQHCELLISLLLWEQCVADWCATPGFPFGNVMWGRTALVLTQLRAELEE